MKYLLLLFLLVDFRIIFPLYHTGIFHINYRGLLVQSIATQTFSYTGSMQTYTVPSWSNSMFVDMTGAAGGTGGAGGTPGKGARVQSTIPIASGTVLNIFVGGVGGNPTGGWNGGGTGGQYGTGGGGATDIRVGGQALGNRIMVAGGGGGCYNVNNCGTQTGGNGGAQTGGSGTGNANAACCCSIGPGGGVGGSLTGGGAAGATCVDSGITFSATAGSLGIGGNAVKDSGGGGGYYGGGGGSCAASGGGGSSYSSDPSATYSSGYQSSSGTVSITFYDFPTAIPTARPSARPSAIPTYCPTFLPTVQPTFIPTARPTYLPSSQPSNRPTRQPIGRPSSQPSRHPTNQPTSRPSSRPSSQPSSRPTNQPTSPPTGRPSVQPTTLPSAQPSYDPSCQPTNRPTFQPSSSPTALPSRRPSNQPSSQPTVFPSSQPSSQPTAQPNGFPTSQPSFQPSNQPSSVPSSQPSIQPSSQPTLQPSAQPSVQPTAQPSGFPSSQPTMIPSTQPSNQPTAQPSGFPSIQPTGFPSMQPTSVPSSQPTSLPSSQPSALPTRQPTTQPSAIPSSQPSSLPTGQPSSPPSSQPSTIPSSQPTMVPSTQPSIQPTSQPSGFPSRQPTGIPSAQPSCFPSGQPSGLPTIQPSAIPSSQPSVIPSGQPSSFPTGFPSGQPTSQPTGFPSAQPTSFPSNQPTNSPSRQPSCNPSNQPTSLPSSQPSGCPTSQPTAVPSVQPSNMPSSQPTSSPTEQPSSSPSSFPSNQPTGYPSCQPSSSPTSQPTAVPSSQPSCSPSHQPTGSPTAQPSSQPTAVPSRQPSSSPSLQPSSFPTSSPSSQPSMIPTAQPFASPTSAPVATIYQTQGVLFWMGTTVAQNDNYYTDAVQGISYILFGRNFNYQSRFPFTLSLSATASRAFVSEIGDNEGAGIRHDVISRSTTVIGDVNGDGFVDLLVGYPLASKCSVYLGNGEEDFSSVIANSGESFAIVGDPYEAGGFLGWSSIRIGNLNNDGFDEILVSAIYSNTIYVIYGKRDFSQRNIKVDELSTNDGFKIIGHPDEINFGVALTLLHDFRKGGRVDLAITAQKAFAGQNVIYILFGAAVFTKNSEDVHIEQIINNSSACFKIITEPFSYAGFSLAGIGDINHDGFDDLAIGSVPYSHGRFVEQTTYFIYGRSNTFNGNNELRLSEMTDKDGFIVTGGGFLVGGAGDVNGDDIPDVIISRYDQWQGKGSSYLMVYPQNITNSPTFRPSSVPSSTPSLFPSSVPNQPVKEGTFPPNLQRTQLPTLAAKTSNPTPSPSFLPTATRFSITYTNPGWPTRKPSSNVLKRPTVLPTKPKRRRETLKTCPTSTPSVATTESVSTVFREIVVDSEGMYDLPSGNVNFIVSGEGSFEIHSNDGGKKIYTILPSKNIITIADFNQKHDQISFIHFAFLYSMSDLVYKTNPLQIVLSNDQQKVILASLEDVNNLSEDNFIFREDKKESDFHWDLAAVICLGVLIGFLGIFGCVTKTNQAQDEDCNLSKEPYPENLQVEENKKRNKDLDEKLLSDDLGSLLLSSSDSEGTEDEDDDDDEFSSLCDSSHENEEERELFETGTDWKLSSSLKSDFSSFEHERDSIGTLEDRNDFASENDFHFIRKLMEKADLQIAKKADSLKSGSQSTLVDIFSVFDAEEKEEKEKEESFDPSDGSIDFEEYHQEEDDELSIMEKDISFIQQLFDNSLINNEKKHLTNVP
jgi:hypothetical protein